MSRNNSMSLGEFDVIERFFKRSSFAQDKSVILGIGDDCALLEPKVGEVIATSVDTLVSGVHFFADEKPFNIGYKAVMVNVSDLAAMGAKPYWLTLALTLPEVNACWLKEFSQGLFQALSETGVNLVGGDTTRGPLCMSLQVQGLVQKDKALRRSGMQAGDAIYVSGPLGGAALGLAHRLGQIKLDKKAALLAHQALCLPQARWQLGLMLSELASSCIDLSDGLISDLNHILKQSHCGARINLEQIPYHLAFDSLDLDINKKWQYALAGGEDYELCFSVSQKNKEKLLNRLTKENIQVFQIGEAVDDSALSFYYNNNVENLKLSGYQHF